MAIDNPIISLTKVWSDKPSVPPFSCDPLRVHSREVTRACSGIYHQSDIPRTNHTCYSPQRPKSVCISNKKWDWRQFIVIYIRMEKTSFYLYIWRKLFAITHLGGSLLSLEPVLWVYSLHYRQFIINIIL